MDIKPLTVKKQPQLDNPSYVRKFNKNTNH